MSSRDRDPTALALRLFLIAAAVTGALALRVAVKRVPAARRSEPAPVAVALLAAPGEPIRAEAQVFRTTPGTVAIAPGARRERTAHPRNLKTRRFLRAYPGAPPRIPHAVTPEEFRTDACRTCHERGGFSKRFDAYVPVTPHPERGVCLQCHVGEDSVMGIAIPIAQPNARCPLCHGPSGGPPRANASLTWATSVWPKLPAEAADGSPPPIPHSLQFRENCLACHSGPAAATEIRTTHPAWVNCRQCHLSPEPEAGTFARPAGHAGAQDGAAP